MHWRDYKVSVPESMKRSTSEFVEAADDLTTFHELFVYTPDDTRNMVSVARLKAVVRAGGVAASEIRYRRWLEAEGCTKRKVNGRYHWVGLELA